MTQQELIEEYVKCMTDIAYYGSKYCQTIDNTQGGYVPLRVFPRQKELLERLQQERYNIVLKPRQAGVSTVSALYCAHLILFATKDTPQKILIVANKKETAKEFLTKMKGYINTAPDWLGIKVDVNNTAEFYLNNGSGAKAVGTSQDALRGYAPTVLVLDETAFITGADELWTSAAPSLSTGGRALFISTPNGQDPLYYKTYNEALKGKSDFKIFDMFWWQDPRYNYDLSFKKPIVVETITEDGKKNKEVLYETIIPRKTSDDKWDFDHVRELIKAKYEPTSTWFESMCRTLNNDERKIAQELKTVFTGSGDNVIKDDYIIEQELNCYPPIRIDGFDNNVHIWEEPIQGHQYLLGSDVSRGDAEDFSSIEIFDIITGNQVLEWHGKVPPDVLGEMIDEYGRQYEAYAVVDITGGMGIGTVAKLEELNYPWIHYSEKSGKPSADPNNTSAKIAGFMISKNRDVIIQCLEEAIRNGTVTIRSKRLIEEMRTFVFINGRADHLRGYHDDLLFALGMILHAFRYSFKNSKRYDDQTTAMLNAWISVNTDRPTYQEKPRSYYNNDDSNDWLFA